MKLIEQPLRFGTQDLMLTNQRALYWKRYDTLILSDLHLGKSNHLRKNGFAVPSYMHRLDLDRLQQLILYYDPLRVLVVGDFIHSGTNQEVQDFRTFLRSFPALEVHLIQGNHDKLSANYFLELGLTAVYNQLKIDNLLFIHEPESLLDSYTISGHIHPGVSFQLPTKKYFKLPCFAIQEKQLILPAFSMFTGLDTKTKLDDVTYYAFHEDGFFVL